MPIEDLSLFAFVLVFSRALGLLALLPLGSRLAGSVKKIALALMLTLLCAGHASRPIAFSLSAVFTEFLVGVSLSLPCVLLVNCAEMLGEMFDVGRGQTVGSIYDPVTGASQPVMSRFARYYVWAILLVSGVFELLIGGFSASFQVLAAASLPLDALAVFGGKMMSLIINMLAAMLTIYLSWALLYLLVDSAAAFWSRVMPQIPFFSEVFQLKSYLAFASIIALNCYTDISGLLLQIALPSAEFFLG